MQLAIIAVFQRRGSLPQRRQTPDERRQVRLRSAGSRLQVQAGPQGAVVSEFSSTSDDESDIFTDPHIKRIPVIEA